jgi:hypothetical protein
MRRVIQTKYRVYELAPDAEGVPVEDYFSSKVLQKYPQLAGAKVYETADGPVVATPSERRRCPPPKPTP